LMSMFERAVRIMRMKGQRGSWLSLVMLCAVAALFTALGFAVLFAGASAVFAVAASSAAAGDSSSQASPRETQTPPANSGPQGKNFSGMITDSHCGARHTRYADMTSAECARLCVRSKGSHYVLVDGESIHGLQGDRTQLDRMATMRVDVVGTLVGDTIKVESISAR
jgi:hypothetical protein